MSAPRTPRSSVPSGAGRSHWSTAAALAPDTLRMGNVDSDLSQPEYRQQLPGAFLEALLGKSWSIGRVGGPGWSAMMARYFTTTANLRAPAMVGFNVWGDPGDYKFFRFAFTSCLLGNGHFSFTEDAKGYSSVPWFDEYEAALGAPVDAASYAVWSNGVVRRRYERAMVLVNPSSEPRTVTIEPGWRRLLAKQDPVSNNGQPVSSLTLASRDGIILVRR